MADDVLDDDDGVVDEDADREDQGEEGDAVEGVAVEVEDQQGQGEGRGDRQHDDDRLAPAEEEQDQEGHAEDGDAHVQQQFVRFLGRGLAVVPSDGDLHIGGDQGAAQAVDLGQHLMHDRDGVGPRPFGQRQGDRRLALVAAAGAEEDIVVRFCRPVADLRDLVKIDRGAGMDADHDPADLRRRGEEGAGLQQHLLVQRRQAAGVGLEVDLLDLRRDLGDGEVARGQLQRVETDRHLAAGAADDLGLGHLLDALDAVVDLGRQPPQGGVVVAAAVEGQGQDRHVVDGMRLDQRLRHRMGDAVEVGLQFLVEADDGGFEVLADVEADDQQALAGHRGRVDVLDAGDFVEQLFHRDGEPLLDLLRGGAGHRHHHVDHRHLDLRFLLARQQEDGEDAEEQRGEDAERGQLRVDEGCGQPAGESRTVVGVRRIHGCDLGKGPRGPLVNGDGLTVHQCPAALDNHGLPGLEAG